MNWDIETEAATSKQRHTLYRLGCSHSFVHKHVKNKDQAAELIGKLLEQHAKLRQENSCVNNEGLTSKTTD